jgi:hypothetical protein
LEGRLISVFSQMIEQKFRTLNYEELSNMLRLTPFRETDSVKEVIKEERIDLLLNLIEVKFGFSQELKEAMAADLAQLDMNVLKALVRQLLRLDTFEQLEVWITCRSARLDSRLALSYIHHAHQVVDHLFQRATFATSDSLSAHFSGQRTFGFRLQLGRFVSIDLPGRGLSAHTTEQRHRQCSAFKRAGQVANPAF